MKLEHPFIQLPLKFDAQLLAQEISAIDESAWLPHPQGFAGNDALTLITPFGDKKSDLLSGPMQPTEYLLQCPYLMQVMQTIGGVWGRTRLMRLSGQAEVERHVDVHYYWRERMRVHVPIVTQPTVRFSCGDQEINMAAGECWIFDTWRWHRVLNDDVLPRIHLVADTVGGEQFWAWLRNSKPSHANVAGWEPKLIAKKHEQDISLRYESTNMPNVMTPWEMRDIFSFLFGETHAHPRLNELAAKTMDLCMAWSALWSEQGEQESAYPRYRDLRDRYLVEITPYADIALFNGHKLVHAIAQSLLPFCVTSQQKAEFVEARNSASPSAATKQNNAAVSKAGALKALPTPIVKPLIIVSSPRSGSSMFFEALANCPDLYTIGGESHLAIEAISSLHPAAKNYDSNILGSADCTAEVAGKLITSFYQNARKHDGSRPLNSEPIRLLEKTPKNALRIPFMATLFPDASFIYLYRNPRHVISSMIDAWQSGRFRTYPGLPGWTATPWSLLLVPGWRALVGKPVHHVVAHQWTTTSRILLDDLQLIESDKLIKVRYETFIQRPQAELIRLCQALDLRAKENLSELPLSQHTLTPPHPDKWKRNAELIEEIWPIVAAQAQRVESFMANVG